MGVRAGLLVGALTLLGCSGQSRAQSTIENAPAAAIAAGTAATGTTAAGMPDTTQGVPLELRSKGSPRAPVTVYDMSDFQCPACRVFVTETFPAVEREYIATGKVRWVFINFPLTQRHPNAAAAAQFAMCAAKAGKFWPVHDLLYKHQDTWAPLKDPSAFFITLADSVHIARPEMIACLQAPDARATVESDAAGAARAGATATPSFYIEGGIMAGAYPIGVFRQVLDSIYAAKTARR